MFGKNWVGTQRFEPVPLELSDLNQVFEIDQLCFKPDLSFPKSFIRFLLSSPDCLGLGIKDKGKLAGLVIAQAENLNRVRLITLDLRPGYRGKGMGKALLKYLHQFLKEKGFSRIVLEVAVDNAPAIKLYQKMGYESVRIKKGYYPDGTDAILMEKKI